MALVYYSQEDPQWKNKMYSSSEDKSQTIGTSACGPTSFAMVASSLLGKVILPPEAAEFAVEHGFRTENNGTAWGFFGKAAAEYGLTCKQTSDISEVKKAIAAGGQVVVSMRSGHFTGGGHYIVLVGVKVSNGEPLFDVFDPNKDNRKYGADGLINQGVKDDGKVTAKEIVFRREAGQYWIFTKEGYQVKKEDADAIINKYLKPAYGSAKTQAEKVEVGRLADELRLASGQPKQN